MGGAGAVVAMRERRMREIADAFRLGDATAPDRARRLEDLGVIETREVRELVIEGVLVPGPAEGTYYLSEAGLIYRRKDRRGLKAILIVSIILMVIGFFFMQRIVT